MVDVPAVPFHIESRVTALLHDAADALATYVEGNNLLQILIVNALCYVISCRRFHIVDSHERVVCITFYNIDTVAMVCVLAVRDVAAEVLARPDVVANLNEGVLVVLDVLQLADP